MILTINTADGENIFLALLKKKTVVGQLKMPARYRQSEELLPAVTKFLGDQRTKITDLKAVAVVTGPGKFTALRIGIAVANTLAYALKIPVVSLNNQEINNKDPFKIISKKISNKKNTLAKPAYGQEPHITTKQGGRV